MFTLQASRFAAAGEYAGLDAAEEQPDAQQGGR
jgi:hypothetical protein